jgi:hypothetical protein
MAYNVTKTSGTEIVVADRALVSVAGGGVQLLGKNFGSYGEIMAENLVHLAEHFASGTSPTGTGNAQPLTGQIWYDTTNKALKVYDNGWNAFCGTDATSLDYSAIKDSSSAMHQAIKIKVGGVVIAIISKDATFTPNTDTGLVAAGFSTIKPGININGTLNGQDPVYKLRGRSIEAEFADMAEIYHSDMELVPGNLIKLGGSREITKTTSEFDAEVFGIISTQPGFLLNSGQQYENLAYPVALKGRVPCIVKGTVRKGQRIVASDIAGIGMATDSFDPATIIGRAIGEKNSYDIGSVEVAVGVK